MTRANKNITDVSKLDEDINDLFMDYKILSLGFLHVGALLNTSQMAVTPSYVDIEDLERALEDNPGGMKEETKKDFIEDCRIIVAAIQEATDRINARLADKRMDA